MIENHVIVTDLGFGDAGKGVTVDRLAGEGANLVVRFSGGAQAAHNVVDDSAPTPRHHTFSQFGAGTFHGVPTHLSNTFLVSPYEMAREASLLEAAGVSDPLSKVSIDARALVTTPVHRAANRAREDARGEARHGSTGHGIGETTWYGLNFDAPRVADISDRTQLARKLTALAEFYAPLIGPSDHEHDSIDEMVDVLSSFASSVWVTRDSASIVRNHASFGRVIFEGSQGVLLDEWNGFHPHTTWATVTSAHARALAAEAGITPSVLGVTRSYTTRHGAGPFPSEDTALDDLLSEEHNGYGTYQGRWRVGHLDLVLLRYAVAANRGVDGIVLTHVDHFDRAGGAVEAVTGYHIEDTTVCELPVFEHAGDEAQTLSRLAILTHALRDAQCLREPIEDVVATVQDATGTPVVMTGHGPLRSQYRWL